MSIEVLHERAVSNRAITPQQNFVPHLLSWFLRIDTTFARIYSPSTVDQDSECMRKGYLAMASFLNQWIALTMLLIVPAAASAAEINAIDLQGNVFSIDTSSGSYTQLGGSSLLFAHSLSRNPDGGLHVIASEGGSTQLFEIDGQSYQPVLPGIEIVLDRNGGGLAFSSNTVGYSVGRVVGPHPILTRIELDSRTSSPVDFIQSDFDLSGLVFRDDGMLMSIAMDYNGVPGQQATLVEIDPSDASIRTIAALSGMSARELGGLVITNEGASFVGARGTGDVSEIWSIDLYTGQHSLRSTVTGIVGLSGVATPIPEPSVALLLGLGLVALAAQRRRISALWMVPLAVADIRVFSGSRAGNWTARRGCMSIGRAYCGGLRAIARMPRRPRRM